ncbi:Tetratricopeptide repeat (TPR)-like superfamily protein [Euphorbia peplus]|nr:Tetratricopeptide repeat (TPR)-like superfamily protein [Euphorbia peplus]
MGLESLQGLQNLHLSFPPSLSTCRKTLRARSSSLSSFISLQNQAFAHSLGRSSTIFGANNANLKSSGLKRSCSADSYQFFDEEFTKQIEDLKRKFDDENDNINNDFVASSVASQICNFSGLMKDVKYANSPKYDSYYSSMSFLPSKLEFLEPNLLGITPEPPEWPERDDIVKMAIQRKANSFDIPLSLRMIGKKQKWEEGFADAGDFAYCSVKKAFSSMAFMIRELQSYALTLQGKLYREDLEAVIKKFQKEMNDSFVWLFQQVFSRTPTLMVYVMLLLANFTVHSMVDNKSIASYQKLAIPASFTTSEEGFSSLNSMVKTRYPRVSVDEIIEISGYKERMTEEQELELWNTVENEAKIMREQARQPKLDQDTMKDLVKSLSVKIESDDYMEFHRTDLVYQMGVAEDPNNPLLLLNYAQFLYLVRRDYDRAEECFKRAIMSGPSDAETFSRYADFLWVARNDLLNAEEVYQQAMEVAPDSHYYASKYANFLWSTGGEETCFPLTTCNEVM